MLLEKRSSLHPLFIIGSSVPTSTESTFCSLMAGNTFTRLLQGHFVVKRPRGRHIPWDPNRSKQCAHDFVYMEHPPYRIRDLMYVGHGMSIRVRYSYWRPSCGKLCSSAEAEMPVPLDDDHISVIALPFIYLLYLLLVFYRTTKRNFTSSTNTPSQ